MRTPAMAAVMLAALGFAAGCEGTTVGSGPTPSASPTVTTTATPGTGQAAACLTGDWRTTGATGRAGTGDASAQLSGGSGVAVTIQPDGAVTADFSGMQPVDFSAQVAGADVRGRFTYGGKVTGTISTTQGATATEGTWKPVPPVDWGDTRLTVDLTEPVQARPFDDVRIGDYVGDGVGQTGNVVDIDPFFGEGTYECQGSTIVLAPADGSGITWTLARA